MLIISIKLYVSQIEFHCRKVIIAAKNETIAKRTGLIRTPKGFIPKFENITYLTKAVTEKVPIYKCHDGYEEQAEMCAPICKNGCEHGICMAPEQCKCSKGYANDKNEYEPMSKQKRSPKKSVI